jgi:hypothetical protein
MAAGLSLSADRNEFSKVAFFRIAARAKRFLLAIEKPPAIKGPRRRTVPGFVFSAVSRGALPSTLPDVFWRMEKYPIRIGVGYGSGASRAENHQMPPLDGFTVAHFLTVADIERSLRFYETVFGSRILSKGDSKGAPG